MPASYTLLVDWDDDGLYTGTGEDVTSRLLYPLRWSRGRDYASQLTGRSTAGQLTAVLDNTSGDYSSFNTSPSPLTGKLLPGRKVRLNVGSGIFPYTFPVVFSSAPQFVGFLDTIEPISRAKGKNVAVLTAYGSLANVNEEDIEIAMATTKGTGAAIGDVLDAVGWPAGDRDIDTGQTTMRRFWLDQQKGLDGLRVVERTEGGFLREKVDGDIRFEDRHARLKAPHTVSQATFSDAVGATLGYSDPKQVDPLPNIFNRFPISIDTYTVGGLATLWTLAESGANSPSLAPGETKSFGASYPNPDSPVDALAVDAWTTLAENTDYEANTIALGGGVDSSGSVGVLLSKLSNSMKITLTNNGSVTIYITLLQARGTPITINDPVRVVAEDSASQATYGKRTFSPRKNFVPTSAEGQNWADYQLSVAKDSVPIEEIRVAANRDAAHMYQVLTRDVSDRVTLVADGKAGLGVNEEFFIESVDHVVEDDRVHSVTYSLSPATAYSGFWVLGTSKLGGTSSTATGLAY